MSKHGALNLAALRRRGVAWQPTTEESKESSGVGSRDQTLMFRQEELAKGLATLFTMEQDMKKKNSSCSVHAMR